MSHIVGDLSGTWRSPMEEKQTVLVPPLPHLLSSALWTRSGEAEIASRFLKPHVISHVWVLAGAVNDHCEESV